MNRKGKKKKILFTIYAYYFMVIFAVTGTMFSTALPRIIQDYQLSLSQAGLFSVFTSLGNLGAMAVTGWLGDRFRKSRMMGAVFMGMGFTLTFISKMPAFLILLILMVILGIFGSILNLIITAFVSDLYGEERARYINMVHTFYGLGSLLGPLYPMLLGRAGLTWRFSYLWLSILVFITGAAYFGILGIIKEPADNEETGKGEEGRNEITLAGLMHYKGMAALCIMSFLYMGGHQNTFSIWFQTYLQTENRILYTPEYTSVCMTFYWVGMVISRFICARLSHKISPRRVILAGSISGILAMAFGMLLQTPAVWLSAVLWLGISTGAIYPMTFAISCEWFPECSARVSSLVGIFTSTGGMLCGWLVGKIAGCVSFNLAMYVPWISLAIVFWIVWRKFPVDKSPANIKII